MATEDKVKKSSAPDGLVSPDSVVVMANVVGVIQLLWRYVQINVSEASASRWLPEEYRKDFVKHFMSCFPYSVHDAPQRKDKKGLRPTSGSNKVSGQSLNLAVCDIMSYFLCEETNQSEAYRLWLSSITNYLISVLRSEKLSHENLKNVTSVFREILKSGTNMDLLTDVYQTCYQLYSDSHNLSTEKRIMMDFLCDQILRPGYPGQSRGSEVLESFLQELPNLLKAVASSHNQMAGRVLKVIKEGIIQRKMSLSCEDLMNILDPNNGVLLSLSMEDQKSVVQMLYYVRTLKIHHFRCISQLIKPSSITTELSCFLLQTLFHRYIADTERKLEHQLCSLDTILSFLITVALGINEADFVKTSNKKLQNYLGGSLPCVTEEQIQNWRARKMITEVAVSLISQLPSTNMVWMAVSAFLDGLPKHQMRSKPFTAWALVAIVNKLYSSNYPITDPLTNCLVKLSTSLMHSLVAITVEKTSSENKADWLDYCETVRRAVIGCLHSHDIGLVKFLQIFKEYVGNKTSQGSTSALTMLTQIVKDVDLLTYLEVDHSQLQEVVQFVEEQLSGDIDRGVLTDLKYHTSLFKAG